MSWLLYVAAAGYLLLANLSYGDTQWHLTLAMIVIGLGLGLSMQVYTLVVQNAVSRRELGTARPHPHQAHPEGRREGEPR